jgi:hypothetical protein
MFVAYTALVIYPLVGLFVIWRSRAATLLSNAVGIYLGGLLFLPNQISLDAPALPAIDKFALAGLVALIGVAMKTRRTLVARQLFSGAGWLLWLTVAGFIGTAITNPDALVYGPKVQQGLTFYDGVAWSFSFLLTTGAPFWLGRALVRTPEDAERVLRVLLVGGALYIPICAIELVMSPQLHKWVYGFSVISFRNIMRGDGYKPVGFLQGGLATAILLYSSLTAGLILAGAKHRVLGIPVRAYTIALWCVLLVSKNLGANLLAVVTLAALKFGGWRMALRAAALIALFSVAYPYLRGNQILDAYPIVDWLAEHSPERADSLRTRLVNEDEMFVRAMERPWFGWGGYGRNRVYSLDGVSNTLQDGAWIITLGTQGIVGLVGLFGLFTLPVTGWVRRLSGATDRQKQVVGGMALMLACRLLDLVPNALFTTEPILLAGALLGLRDHLALWHPQGLQTGPRRERALKAFPT